jgi:beta-phosphoglucomutase-like phosphatase (HAD superfamily)
LIEAVIFDLDGLLVDSEPVWFKARKDFMNKFGLEWTVEDHKIQMGVSTEFWANYTYEKIGGRVSHNIIIDEILGRMISYYEDGEVETLPGASEALSYCADNFIVGLASGSPLRLIDAAIKGKGWEHYFREVVSSDEVEKGKPAPDTYLEIFRRLNISPQKTVVIEDSGGGIMAGFNSGARVIAVPNIEMMPSDDIMAKTSVNLESLHGVAQAIKELMK